MDNDLLKEILTKINDLQKQLEGLQSTWLSIPEVSKYVKASESQIRKLISKGKIPYRRLGSNSKSRILVNKKMLDLSIIYGKVKGFTKREREEAETWV